VYPSRRRLLVLIATAASMLAAGSVGRAEPTPLAQQAADLRAAERAALLQLYGLDSQLAATQSELDRIRSRLGSLRARQTSARARLRLARRTLALSERRLGRTLLALYETDGNDALAVIFGATSLADAVDGLNNLTRVAFSHAAVAEEARSARRRIDHTRRELRAQAAEARGLERAAEAKAAQLASERAERSAYIARVRAEGAALADRIAAVEAEARAARARAEAVATRATAGASVTAFAAAPEPEPAAPQPEPAAPVAEPDPASAAPEPEPAAPAQPPVSGARTMTVTATAYSLRGTTSTGIPVGFGVVAVDPSVIPLGTRMTIPGYGEGVAADTGSGVNGAMIDVWLPTPAQAAAWGTKTLTITLH
jgi:3D (Asp-Asp-Asp) domain-containing protein/peptidoglycan hydrolase CwlO-like protein